MSSTEHDDFPADEDYRSLSVSAVVTAVVGLLSPAVLVWPLLVVLPCLAVVLAVVSLRGIARSGAAGRGLALFGLVVALLSLGLWGGYQTAYRQRVHAQAAPTADKMLELISEGQTQGAFLLTLGPQERGAMAAYFASPERHADDHSDEHPEGEHSPEDQLQDFLEIPAVAQLVASAPLKSWKLTSRSAVQPRPAGRLSVAQTYEVQPAKGPTRRYAIGLEGFSPPNSPPIWRVIGVQPAEAVAL